MHDSDPIPTTSLPALEKQGPGKRNLPGSHVEKSKSYHTDRKQKISPKLEEHHPLWVVTYSGLAQ